MPGIVDVAKLAGVSTASVSRYLNNRNVVKEATAQKIQAAVEALHYSPNPVAVGLRTKQTKMIAFVIPTLNNLYYIELFNDLHQMCIQNGYMLCLYSVEEDLQLLNKILSGLSDYQYDGIIVSYLDEPEMLGLLEQLQHRLPMVLITADGAKDQFSTVFLDVREATYNATRHFFANGRKRVAFIGGGDYCTPRIVISQKLDGYRDAAREAGCEPLSDVPRMGNPSEIADGMTAGILAAQNLMALPEPPDAIVCGLDNIAIGCNRYLKDNGYRVPDDVAVAGFSGVTLASIYSPSISTIVQPLGDMAKATLDLLMEQIEDPEHAKSKRVFHASLNFGNLHETHPD